MNICSAGGCRCILTPPNGVGFQIIILFQCAQVAMFIWPDLDIKFNKDYWHVNVILYESPSFHPSHIYKPSNPKKSALNITDVKLKSIHTHDDIWQLGAFLLGRCLNSMRLWQNYRLCTMVCPHHMSWDSVPSCSTRRWPCILLNVW